jgi:hypothetical protein
MSSDLAEDWDSAPGVANGEFLLPENCIRHTCSCRLRITPVVVLGVKFLYAADLLRLVSATSFYCRATVVFRGLDFGPVRGSLPERMLVPSRSREKTRCSARRGQRWGCTTRNQSGLTSPLSSWPRSQQLSFLARQELS